MLYKNTKNNLKRTKNIDVVQTPQKKHWNNTKKKETRPGAKHQEHNQGQEQRNLGLSTCVFFVSEEADFLIFFCNK